MQLLLYTPQVSQVGVTCCSNFSCAGNAIMCSVLPYALTHAEVHADLAGS